MLGYWSVPVCGLALLLGARRARVDWTAGLGLALLLAPFAPRPAISCAAAALVLWRVGWRPAVAGASLVLGVDARRRAVAIPLGGRSGSHTLIVGATGSGKTVTETLIVVRAIEAGFVPACCLVHLAMTSAVLGKGLATQLLLGAHSRFLERLGEDAQRYALRHDALRRYLTSEEERRASQLLLLMLAGHRNVGAPWRVEFLF